MFYKTWELKGKSKYFKMILNNTAFHNAQYKKVSQVYCILYNVVLGTLDIEIVMSLFISSALLPIVNLKQKGSSIEECYGHW